MCIDKERFLIEHHSKLQTEHRKDLPIAYIPRQECSNYTVGTGESDVEEKEVEVSVVAEPNAVSNPRTVVIHFQNTPKIEEISIDAFDLVDRTYCKHYSDVRDLVWVDHILYRIANTHLGRFRTEPIQQCSIRDSMRFDRHAQVLRYLGYNREVL